MVMIKFDSNGKKIYERMQMMFFFVTHVIDTNFIYPMISFCIVMFDFTLAVFAGYVALG